MAKNGPAQIATEYKDIIRRFQRKDKSPSVKKIEDILCIEDPPITFHDFGWRGAGKRAGKSNMVNHMFVAHMLKSDIEATKRVYANLNVTEATGTSLTKIAESLGIKPIECPMCAQGIPKKTVVP